MIEKAGLRLHELVGSVLVLPLVDEENESYSLVYVEVERSDRTLWYIALRNPSLHPWPCVLQSDLRQGVEVSLTVLSLAVPRWHGSGGTESGATTARELIKRNGAPSLPDYFSDRLHSRGETCAFKDCQRKVYVDPTTRVRSRYCDRGHSIHSDARQGQAVRPIMKIEIINGMQPYNTPMAPAPVRDAATCQYDGCTRNTRRGLIRRSAPYCQHHTKYAISFRVY
ncbi:hypothetical protein PIIN_05623 [Serendipita indica DSM 11827]|uniref:Uncharacterized protein n=1 Tax=Serendipita indica (strain DSM 11827) TaxID=1109443 RepID=G4TK45_SERID|nr:hypothetical protein PIIN_05623 [Serendipita indica DSM 11827]